jgi:signal transduction histidine kinase
MEEISYQNTELTLVAVYTFIAFFFMAMAVMVYIYYTRKKITQNEIERKDIQLRYQKEILKAVIETQEKERIRIAQDMHDAIGSTMNVISLNCSLLLISNITKAESQEILNTILSSSKKVLKSANQIAHDLIPLDFDEFGIDVALKELIEELNNTKSVEIIYTNEIDFFEIKKEKHLHIFRILQELINNSLKHSQARKIFILIKKIKNKIVLTYKDNGKGFDQNLTDQKKGLGLKNIESRVLYIGAEYTLITKIGEGTMIKLKFC